METTINTELPADYCTYTKTQKRNYLETLIYPQGSFENVDELFDGLEKRCRELEDSPKNKETLLSKAGKNKGTERI